MNLLPANPALHGPLLALAAAVTLGAAFIAQYGFGLAPCELCLWQRWPYLAVMIFGLLSVVMPAARFWLVLLAALAFAATSGVGLFHAGVEQGWWKGLSTCSGGATATTLEALRAQIAAAPIVRCDDVPFRFLGLSMAAWNAIWAGALCLLALKSAAIHRESREM